MANNDSGNGHDPWKRDDNGPNDLDKIVRDWQKKFSSILGGGGGAPGGGGGGFALVIMLLIAWFLTGFYRVDAAERGVVQRFGAYTMTSAPGLRWHLPFPIETVNVVNTEEINKFNYSTEMLTADKWYVLIDIVVQYRRTDPVKYSFKVEDPEKTLQDVTESALRGVVGTSTLASLIGKRRDEIPARTMEDLQKTLISYDAGLAVTTISLNTVNYPRIVEEAVADTVRADNDGERYKFEATTYANDVVPKARGQAQRVLQDADAYRSRVIADAEGEAARFTALLDEYHKAPRVTRDRLYIEAIEEVYGRASKVLIDADSSGNLMYLPMDQLLKRSGLNMTDSTSSRSSEALIPSNRAAASVAESRRADSSRERRIRE